MGMRAAIIKILALSLVLVFIFSFGVFANTQTKISKKADKEIWNPNPPPNFPLPKIAIWNPNPPPNFPLPKIAIWNPNPPPNFPLPKWFELLTIVTLGEVLTVMVSTFLFIFFNIYNNILGGNDDYIMLILNYCGQNVKKDFIYINYLYINS